MDSIKGKFTRIKGSFSEARILPRLGKIRLGIKVEKLGSNGTTFPRETQHFVCPPEVEAVYGKEPTELDVILPSDDPEVVFRQKLAEYGSGSGLKCHGNGQEAERYNEQTKQFEPCVCPCPKLKTAENPRGTCTEKSDLMVILPTVSMGGCFQIKTGSFHSTRNINSALDLIRAMAGRISMLPLKLRRVAQETNHEGKKRTHYVLNLILNATWQQVSDLRNNPNSLLIPAQYQIEGPVDENPEFDPPDIQEVDAAEVAEMDDAQLSDLQAKLKQHRNGNGAKEHAPAHQSGVPPTETASSGGPPTTAGSAGPPPAGGSQMEPHGRLKEPTEHEWLDWQEHFKSSPELTDVRDAVLKSLKISGMPTLAPRARLFFLKKAKEEGDKRGVKVEV